MQCYSRNHQRWISTGFTLRNPASNSLWKLKTCKPQRELEQTFNNNSRLTKNRLSLTASRNRQFSLSNKGPSHSNMITHEMIINQQFHSRIDEINQHRYFKTTINNQRQLIYLKPYILNNTSNSQVFRKSMQTIKTEMYKNLQFTQQNAKNKNQNTPNKAIIQYMTEYTGNQLESQQQKQISFLKKKNQINILKQKLMSKFCDTVYKKKLRMIKTQSQQ